MEKSEIRKLAASRRDSMIPEEHDAFSQAVAVRFLAEFGRFQSFLLYSSFKSEVETNRLVKTLHGMKKTVYLPVVDGDELRIGSYCGEGSLSCGAFGIQEPVECTDTKHIDIAVVPGLAFDKSLHRVGYGKGYYDRLLGVVRFGTVVGFGFECQLFETFRHDPHDMPLDALVTEKYIYRRNS